MNQVFIGYSSPFYKFSSFLQIFRTSHFFPLKFVGYISKEYIGLLESEILI